MSRIYKLTEDQLAFIADLKRKVASSPDLNSRFISQMNTIVVKDKQSEETPVVYHSPHKMIEFLSLFSRDDRFKWYTHKWDMSAQFDIEEMKTQQLVDRSVLNEMVYPKESGPVVNERTYYQVLNFIKFKNDDDKDFSWKNTKQENIKLGWDSVIELSKKNPEIPVENLVLEDGHQFRDYIRMFKSAIEFRTDLQDEDRFSELIWNAIYSGLPKDFDITFSDRFDEAGHDLNVYCDVVGILRALNILCDWMIRHKSKSSTVSVDLLCNEDYYILEIFHIGSHFNNLEKLRHPSGDLEKLRQILFSVCDFSMEGDYFKDGKKNGSVIVTALDEKTQKQNNILTPCAVGLSETETGGVKYKLKIYKR